jgi:hypothetical protein
MNVLAATLRAHRTRPRYHMSMVRTGEAQMGMVSTDSCDRSVDRRDRRVREP